MLDDFSSLEVGGWEQPGNRFRFRFMSCMSCVRAGEAKLRGSVRAAMIPPKVKVAGAKCRGVSRGAAGARPVPGGFRVGSGWVPGGFRVGSGWVPVPGGFRVGSGSGSGLVPSESE